MNPKPRVTPKVLAPLSLIFAAIVGFAQSASVAVPKAPAAPAKPPAPLSATEQSIKEIKNPTSWFSWGADLRVRDEYYDSIHTLTDEDPLYAQNVVRFRGRLWTSLMPVTNVSVNVRLAAEVREWTRPAFVGSHRGQQGMEWRYGIFDNLNLKWNNVLDQPLSITAGRQDIVLGDFWNWWLVADGTPLDGSWTYFLDSLRVTYEAKEIKTKFDLIGIEQRAYADEWMPVLNNKHATLVEQNEEGIIFYVSNKSLANTQIDGYFIYKNDEREDSIPNGDNADIYTVGAKVTGQLAKHWSYSVEGGYQFGSKNDPTVRDVVPGRRDLEAFGANGRLSYSFLDRLNNQAHLVYEYLSGDDPGTPDTDEMFDVLWGRWPRWSELYIYSYIQETGGKIAQLNNVQRVGVGWTLSPMKNMHLGAYYNALFAPEDTATRRRAVADGQFSNDGNFRGHFAQFVLKHQFSRHLLGHLWAEYIWQGDYYAQRDLMSFLRAEVSLTF
jgi:hypothetical protein